jgi:hypothetical protein
MPVRSVALRLYAVATALGCAGVTVSRMGTPAAAALVVLATVAFAWAVVRIVRWPILVRAAVPEPDAPLAAAG